MRTRKILNLLLLTISLSFLLIPSIELIAGDSEIKVSAPLYTDSAGFVGQKAYASIFRIICAKTGKMGTGFLHQSGNILTAAHVVADCNPIDVKILLSTGNTVPINNIVKDEDIDIAALTPSKAIRSDMLSITTNTNVRIGAQVSTWGFPGGYMGKYPMLSVGHLSGIDAIKTPSGKLVKRLVVNAAFNSGNSGGPLIDVESGTVIGIVSSKLAPISIEIKKGLEALKKVEFGVGWDITNPDGTKGRISQSQLLEKILQYMRSQTQLVVGRAVTPSQIRQFLTDNKLNKDN